MLGIVSGSRVKQLDADFIANQCISSLDLMERAAIGFCDWFSSTFDSTKKRLIIFAGPGNNGGDGVAIARLLANEMGDITLVVFEEANNCSKDYRLNFERLPADVKVVSIDDFDFSNASPDMILDAIFGVGINRPLEGKYLSAMEKVNALQGLKIAVDIPSGIPSDGIIKGLAFKADHTVTFQFPKLALLFPEHALFTGNIHVVDIGIPDEFLEAYNEGKYFLRKKDIRPLHQVFHAFSHKGDFGKIMLFGGSMGKVGAMVLSSKAALRTGSGLVHVQISDTERAIIQTAVPEVMVAGAKEVKGLEVFEALGIGPGWGTEVDLAFYSSILKRFHKPLVIDADGLNLLAKKMENLKFLPKGSILTPHLKEFERLTGKSSDQNERLQKARDFAKENNIYLVLKGAFTSISTPDGKQYFNSTGNQYMATAGSGDVLTGMITSFLGQGYPPLNAAICGVYHHGLAGEIAGEKKRRGVIASDIIDAIPETFLYLDIV
ncbi:NAD(P)H-hydrate dehydratase [Cecembia sp.]|uniref:NAD(P)H-hydrate dehydratase n=1 Tax=Cecembia sp. TaxID=1898110 RepID=UPI0025BBEFE0|nr:NAD(P)H-hydrate dehydratase [Cecembia sp.]